MRVLRGSVRFVLVALLGLSRAATADAQLLVIATPGDPPAIAHAEVAYAEGTGTPMTWLSLRVARGPVAVVAALPKASSAEPALDAWFTALEATGSPNVVVPLASTNCGQTGTFLHVDWPRSAGVDAAELGVTKPEDAAAALDEQGLKLAADLPEADRYVIWSWPASTSPETTRTLRLQGVSAPLTFSPSAVFPVFVNTLTNGAQALPSEQLSNALRITFVAGSKPSIDYAERLQDWLTGDAEPLVEMRARGPLFDWFIYGDAVSLPPLVRSYALDAARELPNLDADACSDQLRALRDAGAPSAAACGDATDLSLALSAAGPDQPTLQRFVVSGATGFSPSALAAGGEPQTPMVIAKRLDDSACEPATLSPLPQPSKSGGSSGSSTPNGNTTVVVQETTVVDDTTPVEVGCGSSAPGRDPGYDDSQSSGCSSDTSSSSESDSNDSCSGDSSSSSDSSDSGCSSDSSSSSSSDGSDSSDSGCDGGGDQSSGYNGDTCTGNAAPGAEPTDKAQASLVSGAHRPRPRRLKTSLWSLGLAAVFLPIRRRKRGPIVSG